MSVSPGDDLTPRCESVSLLRAHGIRGNEKGPPGTRDGRADRYKIRRQADNQATHTAAIFSFKTAHCRPDCCHAHSLSAAFTCVVFEYLRYDDRDSVLHAALQDRKQERSQDQRGDLHGKVRRGTSSGSYLYAQAQAAHGLSAKRNSSVL